MKFAQKISEWRAQRSWTQSEMARQTKVDKSVISKLGRGEPPTAGNLRRIAVGFGVRIAELLDGVDDVPKLVVETALLVDEAAEEMRNELEALRGELVAAKARIASLEEGDKGRQETIRELRQTRSELETGLAEERRTVGRLREINAEVSAASDANAADRDQWKTKAGQAVRAVQQEYLARCEAEQRAATAEKRFAGLGTAAAIVAGVGLLSRGGGD